MWPDRVSNPGPLTYESGALPTALRGLAPKEYSCTITSKSIFWLRGIFLNNYFKIHLLVKAEKSFKGFFYF